MILGFSETEIVKKAVENQSSMTDGVVQYDYKDGKIFGAGFTTGTVENPANPFIEVFRLDQGERGRIDCRCWESGECPYWIESEDDYCGGHFDEDMENKLYDGCRINCCINAYVDSDDFSEDFENNFKESVEEQIRDVLSDFLGGDIQKLNEIRVLCSDIVAPWDYFNVRQDNWELRVLDSYVDDAMQNGFIIEGNALSYLDAEVNHITGYEYSDNETLREVASLVENHDLNGALELLQ